MTAVKLLSRIWLPLVILLVLGLGGYAVVRLHGIFGSEKYPTYASGPQTDTKPSNPKQLVYEVFGPDGAVADISYFDAQAQPQQVSGAALPWTVTVMSDSPAVVGSASPFESVVCSTPRPKPSPDSQSRVRCVSQ